MIYQCVGKKVDGVRCNAVIDLDKPPNPEHPTWPWLCSDCANAPARKGSRNSNGIVQERA